MPLRTQSTDNATCTLEIYSSHALWVCPFSLTKILIRPKVQVKAKLVTHSIRALRLELTVVSDSHPTCW